jgi:hypothetical protein
VDWDTPLTRMRPIDPPSQVQSRTASFAVLPGVASVPASGSSVATADTNVFQISVDDGFQPAGTARQTAMMQAGADPFTMPGQGPSGYQAPSGYALPPPLSSSPQLGPIAPLPGGSSDPLPLPSLGPVVPPSTSPPPQTYVAPPSSPIVSAPSTIPGTMMPVPRAVGPSQPSTSSTDYAPLAQPRLEQHFATLSNCRNVSAPSGYRSDRILTCGPPPMMITTVGATAPPPVYLPPPAQIGPPVIMPPTALPATPLAAGPAVIPGPAGHRPLISFGQERYPVQVGQGIFGQPVAYVPGQTFRNAIRYITW